MPGEGTQDSAHMRRGFDHLDDSSPFRAEPAYDPHQGGWMTNEMREHLKILQAGTVNEVVIHQAGEEDAPKLRERGFVNDVATQCLLLGGPLGSDPMEGGDSSGHETQRMSPEIHGQDAATVAGSCPGSWGSSASTMDCCDVDPLGSGEGGRKEKAPSSHLVRMSRPISWMQRKWVPLWDDQGGEDAEG